MAHFIGIAPGECKTAQGITARISEDGERAYLSGKQCGFEGGKWFDLAPEHAIIWIDSGKKASFFRPDGRKLRLGDFPAWVVRGTAKHPTIAAMFSLSQFDGGNVKVK